MLQISFLLAILMAIVAIVFVVLKFGSFKTFANNAILFIGITFVLGVIMFGFFYGETHPQMSAIEKTYNSFYSAIKMFAVGNGTEVFKSAVDETTKEVLVTYPTILNWNVEFIAIILIRYVAQISALIVVSGAVISKVVKEFKLGFSGVKVGFKHLFSSHKKSYSRNIVYTDLEYENLRPFLENLKRDPKAVNKVVILKTSATTQHGQELAEIIKLLGIQVVNEGLDFRAFKKFCMFHKNWKINFYSLMENDIDNLAFGEVALKFYQEKVKEKSLFWNLKYMKNKKNKLLKELNEFALTAETLRKEAEEDPSNIAKKEAYELMEAKRVQAEKACCLSKRIKHNNKYDVDFYISFQNESFNNKTSFYRLSDGHIKLVSEYNTVASKFIFENPITRFMYEPGVDVKEKLGIENDINIHFVGFGGINQAIAVKMVPNYQLPNDDIQVHYEILSQDASDKTVLEFLNKFPATQDIYNSKKSKTETFLPQRNLSKFFSARPFNAFNDDEIYDTALNIVNSIINSKVAKPKHIILIALGNSQTNVDIALKLRTQIRNIAKSLDKNLLKKNKHKPVIIYPYVKDNDFFKQSTSLFTRITNDIVKDKTGKIAEITKEEYLSKFDDYARSTNKSYYDNDLSFVFETNYCKYPESPSCHELKKLKLNRKLWYKYFDYFHDVSFKYEELPIINFGRGGYLADPSYEAIIELAKYVNRHYCKLDNEFDMEESWIQQNYQNQQSNIGTVLSFPMKANVLGFKLAYDRSDYFDDYVRYRGKKFYTSFFRHRAYKHASEVLQSCFESYISACDFLEEARKHKDFFNVLDRAAHYTNDFELFIKKNPEKICKELGIKATKELTLETVKNVFADKYDHCLDGYYDYVKKLNALDENDSDYESKKAKLISDNEPKIKAMEEALMAYYNLVCKSLLNDEFRIIRNIEHNRWYFDKTFNGVVPRSLDRLVMKYNKNKSKDGLRHLCMTTNEGLEMVEPKVIRKIAEGGFYIFSPVNDLKPKCGQTQLFITSFKELPFNENDSEMINPLIYNIYNINFYSDVFQYNVLVDYIIDKYINIKEKHSHKTKHNFMLKFLNEEAFEKDKIELQKLKSE